MQARGARRIFRSSHQMRAITPSRKTGNVHRGWASSNPAFTLDSLAACSLAPGAGASASFFTSCYCSPEPFGLR